MKNNTQVFISYTRRDTELAQALQRRIADHDLSVWLDTTGIRPGTLWSSEIETAIKNSAFILAIISHASPRSDWQKEEIQYATRIKKRIVPLLIDATHLPFGLLQAQAIDFSGTSYDFSCFERMLHQLLDVIRPQHVVPKACCRPGSRAIPDLLIANIFAIPSDNLKRNLRMKELLRARSAELRLLARTGFHYLDEIGFNYKVGIRRQLDNNTPFRVILENPYSPAATARRRAAGNVKVWDKIRPDVIWRRLRDYRHLEVRFTDHPVYYSLFFSDAALIYDPYHGEISPAQRVRNQFIVVEFTNSGASGANDYYSLLEQYFEFLWERDYKSFDDLCREHPTDLGHFMEPPQADDRMQAPRGASAPKRLNRTHPEYTYAPIAYHDSWLSIDPILGCSLNCQYCYMRAPGWTGVRPQRDLSLEYILSLLREYPYFVASETVLSFGNQTDPFLEENVDYTLAFLQALDALEFRNPLAFVTKKRVPDRFIRACQKLKSVQPIFCLSYSGLPPTIERGVNAEDIRRNFVRLSGEGLRVLHFWRPLIGVNGTHAAVASVLDSVVPYSCASVYIGLKVSPPLYKVYAASPALAIPRRMKCQVGDYLTPGIEERLRSIAGEKYPHYPLYKHTSCAVSLALKIPDYNATVYNERVCKGSNCPTWKRAVCEGARTLPGPALVDETRRRLPGDINLTVSGQEVELVGRVGQEEFAFVLHRLGVPVRANVRISRNLWGSIYRRHAGSERDDARDVSY